MNSLLFLRTLGKNKIIIAVGALLLFSYWGLDYFYAEERIVPQAFKEARDRSISLTADIVALVSTSSNQLEEVAREDEQSNTERALALIADTLLLNRNAQERATLLARDLEVMAQNLNGISPVHAQRVATAAMSAQVLLVSHLITYNDYSNQLLETLRSKLFGEGVGNVKELALKINNEIEAVNALNAQFTQVTLQFEGYLR